MSTIRVLALPEPRMRSVCQSLSVCSSCYLCVLAPGCCSALRIHLITPFRLTASLQMFERPTLRFPLRSLLALSALLLLFAVSALLAPLAASLRLSCCHVKSRVKSTDKLCIAKCATLRHKTGLGTTASTLGLKTLNADHFRTKSFLKQPISCRHVSWFEILLKQEFGLQWETSRSEK